MKNIQSLKYQSGSALLMSFILMIALTFIAIASVNTGVMEIKMSTAVEEEMNAFQTAAAGVDFVISNTAYLPASGAINTPTTVINCTNTACTTIPNGINLPGTTFATAGTSNEETVTVIATRTADCGLPPRTGDPSSVLNFSSFAYEVEANVDKTDNNRGRSNQLSGFMKLGPKC